MTKGTDFTFNLNDVIITYDLTNNDISAEEIAQNSNGVLSTSILLYNNARYALPTTTLYMQKANREIAINTFISAFRSAKKKKYYSKAEIINLLVLEVGQKSAFIYNE